MLLKLKMCIAMYILDIDLQRPACFTTYRYSLHNDTTPSTTAIFFLLFLFLTVIDPIALFPNTSGWHIRHPCNLWLFPRAHILSIPILSRGTHVTDRSPAITILQHLLLHHRTFRGPLCLSQQNLRSPGTRQRPLLQLLGLQPLAPSRIRTSLSRHMLPHPSLWHRFLMLHLSLLLLLQPPHITA